MQEKLTITIDEAVYRGLYRFVGRSQISEFIEGLLRPHTVGKEMDSSYREMALDVAREAEADAWSEALIGDGTNEQG
jgi:hypothetical protein